jgi:hypothetical protein
MATENGQKRSAEGIALVAPDAERMVAPDLAEVAAAEGAVIESGLELEAGFLMGRAPADARVVFYAARGVAYLRHALPAQVMAAGELRDFEILLPTEEASLRPLTAAHPHPSAPDARVAPALWRIPGLHVPLAVAVPVLAERSAEEGSPGVRFLAWASRLAISLLARGDFAPASPDQKRLHYVPWWSAPAIAALRAVSCAVPEALLTARLPAQDEPIHATTPRALTVGFVAQAIDVLGHAHAPAHARADRLPRDFWRGQPAAVLKILAPERELEEGVPWGVQLLFRPALEVGIERSLEQLRDMERHSLFADGHDRETMASVQASLEAVAIKLPFLRRAMNMQDGKASLNRAELDQVLDHLALLESEGFTVLLPGFEQPTRLAARVELKAMPATVGERPWFEFDWKLALNERELSKGEFDALVEAKSPLVVLRGGPVLLSPRDRHALMEFKKREARHGRRVSFFEALRLRLAGASHLHGLTLESLRGSPQLDDLVENLERARKMDLLEPPSGFVGELRTYQTRGFSWAYYLADQGFGACLADDMGLGKTIQAIALILEWQRQPARRGLILIVCPVSVLGNWRRELHRFAPQLRVTLHHGKGRASTPEEFQILRENYDVVLTSYNLVQRDQKVLAEHTYAGVVLDEAQNIKNPGTRQSQVARRLSGGFRIALTGTPLENRPLDLWSIMDFLNEGLLGTRSSFIQTLEHPIVKQRSRSRASALARLVRPFVLRRLKTDPEIVVDLPENRSKW